MPAGFLPNLYPHLFDLAPLAPYSGRAEAGRGGENALGLQLADHFFGFRLDVGRLCQPLQFAIQLGECVGLGRIR